MNRGFRVKVHPNNKQRTRLFSYANAARFAYSWAIAKERECWQQHKKLLGDSELRKEFTKLKHLDEYKWLNRISCDVMKQAIKDAVKASFKYVKDFKENYKNLLRKVAKIEDSKIREKKIQKFLEGPKFKSKRDSVPSFYLDGFKIRFNSTHVWVVSFSDSRKRNRQILNWVRLAEVDRIPIRDSYLNPRMSFDGIDWWISVAVKMDDSEKEDLNDSGIGIDVGVKDLAICSDGFTYKNINKTRKVRNLEKRNKRVHKSLSRKLKEVDGKYIYTKNFEKTKKILKKIYLRLCGIRTNHIHQVSTEIVNRKPRFICVEDLNVKGMLRNRHLSKAISNQKISQFLLFIKNKASVKGISIIEADRLYPSSKRCIRCGNIKKDLKLKDRIYHCDVCGNTLDRDYQASLNLREYGIEHLT